MNHTLCRTYLTWKVIEYLVSDHLPYDWDKSGLVLNLKYTQKLTFAKCNVQTSQLYSIIANVTGILDLYSTTSNGLCCCHHSWGIIFLFLEQTYHGNVQCASDLYSEYNMSIISCVKEDLRSLVSCVKVKLACKFLCSLFRLVCFNYICWRLGYNSLCIIAILVENEICWLSLLNYYVMTTSVFTSPITIDQWNPIYIH